jgi:CRP-like cAMP-binding protein
MEKVDLLQSAELFREVRTENLARVAAIAQEETFETRQVLYSENEAADSMFVLLDGEVMLTGAGWEEVRLKGFQVAGALSLFADLPQAETARASQPTRTLRLGQQDLLDVMAEDFQITRGILRALAVMVKSQSLHPGWGS